MKNLLVAKKYVGCVLRRVDTPELSLDRAAVFLNALLLGKFRK